MSSLHVDVENGGSAPAPGPSPSPAPAPASLTVDQIQKYISLFNGMGAAVCQLIPGTVDDEIFSVLKMVDGQPWFAELVVNLVALVKNGKGPAAVAAVKAMAHAA